MLLVLALVSAACGGGGDDVASGDQAGGSADSSGTASGSEGSGGQASGEPCRLGVLLGLTGAYAAVAEPQQQAINLFEEQVNAAGGINGQPLELVVVDTASNESEAVNQLRRLATQEQVIGVVGPSSSGEALALKPIAQSLQLPTVAIAAAQEIVDPVEPFVFKQFPASTDSLRAQLTYAQEQGWNRVAILSSNNAYGQDAASAIGDLVDEFGLELVAQETFPPDATDMTPQLSSIAGQNPDATLVWSVNPANAIVAENASAIDLPGTLFQAPGAASTQYMELGGDAVEGTLVQGSKILVPDSIEESDPQFEAISSFVDAWGQAYDGQPNQFGAGAWDAMLIAEEALSSGDVDCSGSAEEVRTALQSSLEQSVSELPGTIAVYDFGPDVHGPAGIEGQAVLVVQDGEFALEAVND